nr:hypothetical protein [Tanacetum cinerariifolium]
MTSFGYRFNPLYAIKECSSCGTLYTRDCVCSIGTVEDKILVSKPPKNCARYFQNSSEPSNASTNVVNAPREPNVVKQDNRNVLRVGETCKRCTCTKCGNGLGKGPCYICGHNQNTLNDSPSIFETSSQSPPNINQCCYECGDPLDAIFFKRCTCKSCGKDAHTGYNCPSKVLVISIPEPYNNQTINELPQALPIFHPTFHSEAESPFTLDSTLTYVDESPNIFNPPPQPSVHPCEFCGNDAYYGHYCTPPAPLIYPEPCYNQNFNFSQYFQDVPQQYTCCYDCGVTHDPYQCQPLNHDYYHGQNSYYDSNSIGFDQSLPQQYTINHPIFSAHKSCLDSRIQLNITPSESVDSLIMGDEHLNTILATESDEFNKSCVENLVPNPSESEGKNNCDVPAGFTTFSNALFDAD